MASFVSEVINDEVVAEFLPIIFCISVFIGSTLV